MSFRHDGSLLVGGGENGVAVVEGLHNIPNEVHEFVGLGLAGKATDFHGTAEGVDNRFTCSNWGINLIPEG